MVERLEAAKIKAVPTGIDHGTITAVSDGQPVEVTTLRRDVSTDGRRATVAFTDDWKEDAARRDFTINALMADPATGELFDYFGGLADIEARRVRFIGDPLQRIAEDHLRILRFFRFHARFGAGEPDGDGLDACTARANDLMALSRERIADELLKLLAVDDPSPTVALMLGRDILKPVIPEIEAGALASLRDLVAAERDSGLDPEALRRLVALLPADPDVADDVARAAQIVEQGAQAAGLRGVARCGGRAAPARLPPRPPMRGRPLAARWPARRRRGDRRLVAAQAADRRRHPHQARSPPGARGGARAQADRGALGRSRLPARSRVRAHRRRLHLAPSLALTGIQSAAATPPHG